MFSKKKVLVVGSIAYDHLMHFKDAFSDVIMPDNLNMVFPVSYHNFMFGGCGGNIAYSLKQLGIEPLIMTTVGSDFHEYKKYFKKMGMDLSGIMQDRNKMTASAYIVTDKNQNQITIFDPGAMQSKTSPRNIVSLRGYKNIELAIISPDSPKQMLIAAEDCKKMKIPYVFDAGQQINAFVEEDLRKIIVNADYFIANDYETSLLMKKLGVTKKELLFMPKIYIQTHGKDGSTIHHGDKTTKVEAVKANREVDPTGCGDAFRAGFVAGLQKGYDLKKCCQLGSLIATYNLENEGTQNHILNKSEIEGRFQLSFNIKL